MKANTAIVSSEIDSVFSIDAQTYLRYLLINKPIFSFSYHQHIPGRPGSDYPILPAVPYTNFYCDEQKYPGFFADTETRCQGWNRL